MSQARLNHLAILHVHQMFYGIDVLSVAKDFVAKSDSRMFTFGRVCWHVNRADSWRSEKIKHHILVYCSMSEAVNASA